MKVISTTKKTIDYGTNKRLSAESSQRISAPINPTISDEIDNMKVL